MNWSLLKTSFYIWIKALMLDAFFIFVYASFSESIWAGFGWSVFGFIGGAVITSPLLVVVYQMVKYSLRIPYSSRAQIAWLAFMLAAVVTSIILGIIWAGDLLTEKEVQLFIYGVFLSIILSIFFTSERLRQLSASFQENDENSNQSPSY